MKATPIIAIAILAMVSCTAFSTPTNMDDSPNLYLQISSRAPADRLCRLSNLVKLTRCYCYATFTGIFDLDKASRMACLLLFQKQNIRKFKGSCRRFMKDGEFLVEEFEDVAKMVEEKCVVDSE